jgi:hypothetical protein
MHFLLLVGIVPGPSSHHYLLYNVLDVACQRILTQ